MRICAPPQHVWRMSDSAVRNIATFPLGHITYSKAVNSIPNNILGFFHRVIGGRVSKQKKQCAKTGGLRFDVQEEEELARAMGHLGTFPSVSSPNLYVYLLFSADWRAKTIIDDCHRCIFQRLNTSIRFWRMWQM